MELVLVMRVVTLLFCAFGEFIEGEYCLEGNKDKAMANVWRDLELLILPFFSSCFTIFFIIISTSTSKS